MDERVLGGGAEVEAGGGSAPAAWLCAGCGLEVGPGRSLCEDCEEELLHRQGVAWP
jgi:predicted amidophosphoribosyltransferase